MWLKSPTVNLLAVELLYVSFALTLLQHAELFELSAEPSSESTNEVKVLGRPLFVCVCFVRKTSCHCRGGRQMLPSPMILSASCRTSQALLHSPRLRTLY
jgi:hypothetical protein